jgi:hypothetical protein
MLRAIALTLRAIALRLPVYFTQYDIERSNNRHNVRNHVARDHLFQRLKIHE